MWQIILDGCSRDMIWLDVDVYILHIKRISLNNHSDSYLYSESRFLVKWYISGAIINWSIVINKTKYILYKDG
jgi:hypothetical protein